MKILKQNASGFTLLEIVAAVFLLSIIFIGFFSLFIASKKVSVASEEIVDATYINQQIMEEVYSLSQTYTIQKSVDYYLVHSGMSNVESNYHQVNNSNNFYIKFDHQLENISVEINFDKQLMPSSAPPNLNLYNTTVTTKEKGVIKSKMENIFSLRP
jgi:type II secretory pathway pseudopilin PulG